MLKFKHALSLVLMLTLSMLLIGCQESAADVVQADPDEAKLEQTSVASEASVMEVTVPAGKTDRLPGSLKWDSVAVYSAGIDFVVDQPAGLRTQVTASDTTTGTIKQTAEATTASIESEQSVSSTGSTSTASSYQSSTSGVSTSIQVDGTLTVKEQTTIDSGGSGSDSNWWNYD